MQRSSRNLHFAFLIKSVRNLQRFRIHFDHRIDLGPSFVDLLYPRQVFLGHRTRGIFSRLEMILHFVDRELVQFKVRQKVLARRLSPGLDNASRSKGWVNRSAHSRSGAGAQKVTPRVVLRRKRISRHQRSRKAELFRMKIRSGNVTNCPTEKQPHRHRVVTGPCGDGATPRPETARTSKLSHKPHPPRRSRCFERPRLPGVPDEHNGGAPSQLAEKTHTACTGEWAGKNYARSGSSASRRI